MVSLRTLAFAAAALAIGCASTPDLRMQADPPINLSGFSTYQWTEAANAGDPTLSDLARDAVARRLSASGLAGSAQGDIAVAVSLGAQTSKHVTDFGDAFFIPGYGPHPGIHVPGAYPRYDVQAYTEGQLAITIYNAHDQTLLWRGVAVGPVDPTSEEDIGRLVDALLAHAAS